MFNRIPSRLARPSSTLFRPATTSRLALTRPSIRTATTAHNEHRGDDTHGHHASGHDDHFDAPSGWLWGIRPGEKAEKEGWEGLAWVYVGVWVVAIALYTMKEDTTYVLPFCFTSVLRLALRGNWLGVPEVEGVVVPHSEESDKSCTCWINCPTRHGRGEKSRCLC